MFYKYVLIETPQHIFDSVQASLKRLQVDYIDLLQCESHSMQSVAHTYPPRLPGHRFDYNTPIAETVSRKPPR